MLLFSMLSAFIIATLSGMGVGGGGLFVIYLSLFTDTPQLLAQGMNLLFFLFSAGASVTVHLQKRTIYFAIVGILAISGIIGAFLGAYTVAFVNQSLLRKIFGVMLVISGILSLQKKKSTSDELETNH